MAYAAGSTDNQFDTIDLTLSSPEPEHQPRFPPAQQLQLPNHFKREPHPRSMAPGLGRTVHPGSSGPRGIPRQEARSINPEHLRRIINTSDPRALQKTLLHLCQMSPALSGAVVRGLAPHSTFARGLINQHQMSAQTSTAPPPRDDDSDAAYERMRRRMGAEQKLPTRDIQNSSTKNRAEASSRVTTQMRAVSDMPQVKREYKRRSPGTDTDGDDDIHLPEPYPRSVQRVGTLLTPLRNRVASPSKLTPRPLSAVRPTNIKRAPATVLKRCIQCHESFEGDSELCIYHPSNLVRHEDGLAVYSCCGKSTDDLGCQYASHVDKAE